MESLLNGLPLPAAIACGVTIGIVFIVRYLGMSAGERAGPTHNPGAAQVAAVIVDPTALNRLSDVAARLNVTLEEMVDVAKDKIRVDGIMASELDRIREELRIQRELSRGR